MLRHGGCVSDRQCRYVPVLEYDRGCWRGAGAVERGGLENRCTLRGTVGSNPTPSANIVRQAIVLATFFDLPLDCVPLSVPQLFVDRPELKRTVADDDIRFPPPGMRSAFPVFAEPRLFHVKVRQKLMDGVFLKLSTLQASLTASTVTAASSGRAFHVDLAVSAIDFHS